MTEPRRARCPYCLEILDPVFLPFTGVYLFPDHRGHWLQCLRLHCVGWGLPIVEANYVTKEEVS